MEARVKEMESREAVIRAKMEEKRKQMAEESEKRAAKQRQRVAEAKQREEVGCRANHVPLWHQRSALCRSSDVLHRLYQRV